MQVPSFIVFKGRCELGSYIYEKLRAGALIWVFRFPLGGSPFFFHCNLFGFTFLPVYFYQFAHSTETTPDFLRNIAQIFTGQPLRTSIYLKYI
jgi:hypothetical protein